MMKALLERFRVAVIVALGFAAFSPFAQARVYTVDCTKETGSLPGGQSRTVVGVTVGTGANSTINFDQKMWLGGAGSESFVFSLASGSNILRIEMTCSVIGGVGGGWTITSPGYVWTGNAKTVKTGDMFQSVTKVVVTSDEPEREPDYAKDDGKDWLYNHAITGKACPDEATVGTDVDLFYVYPTLSGNEKIVVDGFRGIDDASMRSAATNYSTAVGAFVSNGRCFAGMTHVYAPFYRQATLGTACDCATNAQGQIVADANARYLQKLCEGPAYSDVTNALTTYFAKWNKGRRLVFAAHSQGSALLRLVMENYFALPENRDKAKQIVCSYQIGYGIGQSSIDKITAASGVKFAEKADDTNVIVSYNTMSGTATDNSILLPSDTLAINPITWTRGTDLADKALNIGAITNAIGQPDVIVPGLYSAQVSDTGEKRGQVVVCTELAGKEIAESLFGPGSLHGCDYSAFWENLRANVYDRGGKLAGYGKFCTTNFPKHLCVGEAEVCFTAKPGFLAKPVGGTVWIPTNGLDSATVYLVAEKGYRLLWHGGEASAVPVSLYPGSLKENGEFLASADEMAEVKVEWATPTDTNGFITVENAAWKLMVGGEEAAKDEKGYCVPAAAEKVRLVYACTSEDDEMAFVNGERTTEFALKLENDTWKLTATADEIKAATATGKPTLQLGVVAQRYPWDGSVDVPYRLRYAKTAEATLKVTANGVEKTQDVTLANGDCTLVFDAKAAFGEIKARDVKFTLKLK